jgi:hypothetical protein
MTRILGSAEVAPTAAIVSVIEQAVDEGAPEPPWVAVADDAGRWVAEVSAATPAERARSVVAVRADEDLVRAARLAVGGAIWLPPSTVDAGLALRAAASASRVDSLPPDPWNADVVCEPDQRAVAVTWNHRAFWRCQVGERTMARLLARLAEALGELPVVLPWPALVLPDRDHNEILDVWEAVIVRAELVSEGVSVISCGSWQGHCGLASVAMAALVSAEDEAGPASEGFPRAVCELPSGRLMGGWAPAEPAFDRKSGSAWLAVPEAATRHGFNWRLIGGEEQSGRVGVQDVLACGAGSSPALRVPGWCASEAGAGRPAGLLVERLAADAHRRGLPLWVPNVDHELLQFLLRLPGTFWVDGPAVPEPS